MTCSSYLVMWVHQRSHFLWVSVGWQGFVWDRAQGTVVNHSHLQLISLSSSTPPWCPRPEGQEDKGRGRVSSFAATVGGPGETQV